MSSEEKTTPRPPVVAIMGHVDHGKSSLLDYIRESNVVDGEAGGITQHIAAYEVTSRTPEGEDKKITFIDTPGHAAFSMMRNRGARIADIAILIVSAEDSVKDQTIEAIQTIKKADMPYIVAINKIDKPNADVEKVKQDLLAHEVYVEGYGGDISVAPISAKTGQGVDDLLEIILLVAEMEDFKGTPEATATGFVVESHLDQKRGVSATLIIKNGTLERKQFVVVDDTMTATRIMEDYTGATVESATFSSPVALAGFSKLPDAGSAFTTHTSKKDAERAVAEYTKLAQSESKESNTHEYNADQAVVPMVIKSDVAGSQDALIGEIDKLSNDDVYFKIIKADIGDINESDIQTALSDPNTIILGFNVGIDTKAKSMNEAENITMKSDSIIYKLTEWLEEERENRRIKKEVEDVQGTLNVLKHFSSTKTKHVIGGSVTSGTITMNAQVKLIRRDNEIARGKITNLQLGKAEAKEVNEGNECGLMVEMDLEPASGDVIEAYKLTVK